MKGDTLDAIYAAIPPVAGCRRGCSDCCQAVPMGRIEAERVRHVIRPLDGHRALPRDAQASMSSTPAGCNGCAYAGPAGCAIYQDRPFVCRLFAAVEGNPDLACPHGARAERPLSRAEADALGMRYMEIIDRRPSL